MKKSKIIFTGGGTGGHVFPLVSIIRNIKNEFPKDHNLEMYYIAPKDEIPDFNFTQEDLKTRHIFAGKLRRYMDPVSIIMNIIDMIKIPVGVIQSIFHIFVISPDIIFSKGGYGSVPVALAGALMRIPIILHESDACAGLANRIVAKLAAEVFVAFQDTKNIPPNKMIVVGNPIRKEVISGSKENAQKRFAIKTDKPILLVLGGSQGSERINDVILAVINQLLEHFEVIHQCGINNIEEIKAETDAFISKKEREKYHPFSFLNEGELRDAYAISDLIISRAGSGSIFEILANNKPGILIPLPEAAQNHQAENAYRAARFGAAIVMEEENLTPHFLLERIKALISSPEELNKMKENTEYFSKPDAGRILASYLIEFLTQD